MRIKVALFELKNYSSTLLCGIEGALTLRADLGSPATLGDVQVGFIATRMRASQTARAKSAYRGSSLCFQAALEWI